MICQKHKNIRLLRICQAWQDVSSRRWDTSAELQYLQVDLFHHFFRCILISTKFTYICSILPSSLALVIEKVIRIFYVFLLPLQHDLIYFPLKKNELKERNLRFSSSLPIGSALFGIISMPYKIVINTLKAEGKVSKKYLFRIFEE